MITVEITLNGRVYPVACNEAEAPRIRELGRQLSTRVAELQAQSGGAVDISHWLVLTNLMALDELSETRAKTAAPAVSTEEKAILVSAVEHLTTRVNNIAKQLRAA